MIWVEIKLHSFLCRFLIQRICSQNLRTVSSISITKANIPNQLHYIEMTVSSFQGSYHLNQMSLATWLSLCLPGGPCLHSASLRYASDPLANITPALWLVTFGSKWNSAKGLVPFWWNDTLLKIDTVISIKMFHTGATGRWEALTKSGLVVTQTTGWSWNIIVSDTWRHVGHQLLRDHWDTRITP